MRVFYFSIFLLFVNSFLAQKATLKGNITDSKTGEALIGANVITEEGTGSAADFDGNYKIELEPGTHKITYKFVGYKEVVKTIKLTSGETKTVDIILKEGEELDEFVFSGSKFKQKPGEFAGSVDIIKSELFDNKAAVTAEAVVDQSVGVQLLEGQVSIRGGSGFAYGGGSRVLMMIDDLPMLAADAGDIKWNSLPIENLEQMEVIKGASSVLYGSSALNGVINIRTAFPGNKPKTKINLSNGIYLPPSGTQRGTAMDGSDSTIDFSRQRWNSNTHYYVTGNFLHSRKIKENFDLVVGGNFATDKGYRLGENEHRGRLNFNTRYRAKKIEGLSVGINGNYNLTEEDQFFLWQNGDSALIPQGGLDTATTTISEILAIRANLDPYLTYYTPSGNKHSIRTRWYNTTNKNNTNQGSIANLYYTEYQFQKQWDSSQWSITTGLMNNYSTVSSELYGDHFANNTAAFFQANKKIGKFNLVGGVRLETYQIDTSRTRVYTNLLPKTELPFKPVMRFGATFEAADYTWFRASYGEGYRFPTIAERYIATSVGGLNVFPNPQVQPETGWSAEVGVKQGFKIGEFKGYIDVVGFMTEYNNMMEFVFGFFTPEGAPWDLGPDGTNYPTFSNFGAQSQNVENASIKGGEISLTGTGQIGEIGVSVLAGYTFIDPRVGGDADTNYLKTFSDIDSSSILKYRSPHIAKADIQLEYKKLAVGFSARYNSFQQNIDYVFVDPLVGGTILPGFNDYRNARRVGDIIADVRVSYSITEKLKVAALVNNIFNREYSSRPGNVMPPRTFITQVSVNF